MKHAWITIRMAPEIKKRIVAQAEKEHRSFSGEAVFLIESALKALEAAKGKPA